MASLAIRYLPPASDELEAAIDWYEARSPASAAKFSRIFLKKLMEAAAHPHHWALERDGTRHILLHPFSYYIVVRELVGILEVVAVSHTSRKPGYWRKRLKRAD
jgi:plasmid stabilization system protein ParE